MLLPSLRSAVLPLGPACAIAFAARRAAGIVAVLAAVWVAQLRAQDPVSPDSTPVVLGPAYARAPGAGFLRGEGWRELWTDTLLLPLLRLDPLMRGQVFHDADGLAWRIVPVDHTPVEFDLPEQLRGGKVEGWLADFTTTMHPTAPLAASALYESVGLHALLPRLAATPDGRGVWIERAAEEDGKPLDGLERVITSDSLLALLSRDPTTQMDLRAFLRARLLDIVLGDRQRDRHGWLWGLERQPTGLIWVPIATRQQQAFLHADFTGRFLLGSYAGGFTAFKAGRPETRALAEPGYDFDRPLLARIDRPVWDSVGAELRAALTSDAIEGALARLPPPHRDVSAAKLASTLEARRDQLPAVVRDFYREVMSYPDLELSDAPEEVRITRLPSKDLELRVSAGDTEVLHRLFRVGETHELRLHLRGGDDRVTLDATDGHGIGVRITGGAGHDLVERRTDDVHRVVFYDLPHGVRMNPDDLVRLVPRQTDRFRLRPDSSAAPRHRDWGVAKSPVLAFDINGDLGLVLGGGMQWTMYGFDEAHYRQRIRAAIQYASRPGGFRTYAAFERRDVLRNLHLTAGVRAASIDVVRFFGYGNETSFTRNLDYYRAESREVGLILLAGLSRDPVLEFRIGPALRIGGTDTTGAKSLVSAAQPYGSGRFNMAGVEAQFNYTPRRPRYEQGFGFWARANGHYYPEVLDVSQGAFGGVDG
ncbi:MAG: hypothetical protein OEW17_04050, partial [Gemmatimonadota bacterium]|nr:hypothetical protein [Gemmatimonadota bacterium]